MDKVQLQDAIDNLKKLPVDDTLELSTSVTVGSTTVNIMVPISVMSLTANLKSQLFTLVKAETQDK